MYCIHASFRTTFCKPLCASVTTSQWLMMKTVANPTRTVTDSRHFYCTGQNWGGGVYRGRTVVRMRGIADNHPIYTQTVQLMYPGPTRGCVCVCVEVDDHDNCSSLF